MHTEDLGIWWHAISSKKQKLQLGTEALSYIHKTLRREPYIFLFPMKDTDFWPTLYSRGHYASSTTYILFGGSTISVSTIVYMWKLRTLHNEDSFCKKYLCHIGMLSLRNQKTFM